MKKISHVLVNDDAISREPGEKPWAKVRSKVLRNFWILKTDPLSRSIRGRRLKIFLKVEQLTSQNTCLPERHECLPKISVILSGFLYCYRLSSFSRRFRHSFTLKFQIFLNFGSSKFLIRTVSWIPTATYQNGAYANVISPWRLNGLSLKDFA